MNQTRRPRTVRTENASSVAGARVLFDANIWIFINGPNGAAPQDKVAAYSSAYNDLIVAKNDILINDYVIGEFCNRCAKLEYDLYKASLPAGVEAASYKRHRRTQDFQEILERIGESCLEMTRDCIYVNSAQHCVIDDVIERFKSGEAEFSDLVIADCCRAEGAVLMTDDGDFLNCGLDLITANPYLIRMASRR